MMFVFRITGLVFIFAASSWCVGQDTQCSRYHFQEQTLAKLVRLDFRLELLEKMVNDTAAASPDQACPDMWIPFKGSCYLFANELRNHHGARYHCIEHGAHLVYIETLTENEFLQRVLGNYKDFDFWIGLTDLETEGQFKYDGNDDLVSFTDWHSLQPDNSGGIEDCVHLHYGYSYKWNDANCNNLYKSICEK